jgi:predicted HTH domain antitoxin
MSLTITIPDDFAGLLGATPEERERRAREALALELYREGKVSAVAGSHLAGMDLISFQGLLVQHGIPRNSTVKDLHDDLATLDRLLGA